MIEKKTVCQIVEEWLEGKDYFLVEVTVSPDDKIVVEIDHAEGVWIEDCVELSRYIESKPVSYTHLTLPTKLEV